MRIRLVGCCLLSALALLSCKGRGGVADTVVDTVEEEVVLPRSSVTFILGRDHYAYNQYYTLAGHYYRLSADDRTDAVVDNLTSLSQVIDYLNTHPDTVYGRPYGLINLVSHGNEFIDLQMTVTPKGARVSVASLRQAMEDSLLAPLDSGLVDSRTLIHLHGCAVGHNQGLLDGLARAFGGEATVVASKLFEYYAYLSRNHNPQSVRHYYARTWYAFYHPDSTTGEDYFVRQLQARYPHDSVDWRAGLRRRFQNNPSELYHFSFVVPCSYEALYDDATQMPSVGTRKKRQQWVDGHADFRALMDSAHIPQQYFQVKFYRQTYLTDDDNLAYGLKVKGRAGVVCLIQPLVCPDTVAGPYAPCQLPLEDTVVFACSR